MKIDFEFQTEYGLFRDALHLDDNHNLSEDVIAEMKRQRVDNWLAIITAPEPETPVIEPVIENNYIEIDGVRYVKVVDNG